MTEQYKIINKHTGVEVLTFDAFDDWEAIEMYHQKTMCNAHKWIRDYPLYHSNKEGNIRIVTPALAWKMLHEKLGIA